MTQAEQIIEDLTRRGVTLETDGERLRFHPASSVDAAMVERLNAHKAELIQLVKFRSAADAAQGVSQGFSGKSGVPLFQNGISGSPEAEADSVIRETFRRVNEAFPPTVEAVDWHAIDRWHWALSEARRCDDLPGLRTIAANFEAEMRRLYPPTEWRNG